MSLAAQFARRYEREGIEEDGLSAADLADLADLYGGQREEGTYRTAYVFEDGSVAVITWGGVCRVEEPTGGPADAL